MDILFLCIVIFLFLLAVFDLTVGVSNDAVNFLTSAVGSKAASFRRIIAVASVGVFIGAAMSNGMMDLARHGIFKPETLSFYDVTAIFMAVMVTDIIILDVFNTLGLPTSTTVSMVFELLGATFVVALFKIAGPGSDAGIGDLMNTERALSVILGIFLSVAIAFVFGTIVQFITRLVFTFEYKSKLKWKVGLFGGIACTAIIYFMLIKGVKDLSFMTPEVKAWISADTWLIIGCSLVFFTLLSQLLYILKVNVLKQVVLLGTFSLAMAFAGNDLVNFLGVPLSALSSYQDFAANGAGDVYGFNMASLNGPADTPLYFLIGAGVIMVVALATSSKARQVTKTSVGLSSQSQGDEMFGSSRLGRSLVRASLNAAATIERITPKKVKSWIGRRMNSDITQPEEGAAFDLVRASVNLMLAGILIAWGTSMKLPLSTTFVTFMVAMGTSLADKAWGRESAVFRITGVISVIGGWFITAGVAFIGTGIVVCLMHLGGIPVMIAGGVIAVSLLIRSNIRFRKRNKEEKADTLFLSIVDTENRDDIWPLMKVYVNEKRVEFIIFAALKYGAITSAFANDSNKELNTAEKELRTEKATLKSLRRKQTLCLRRLPTQLAMEKATWFYLGTNMSMSMLYSLIGINEVCREHVSNNFHPLPERFHAAFDEVRRRMADVLGECAKAVDGSVNPERIDELRRECENLKSFLTHCTRDAYDFLRTGDQKNMTVTYVFLNVLQESQEFVTSLRKLLRASGKFNLAPSSYRSFSHAGKTA